MHFAYRNTLQSRSRQYTGPLLTVNLQWDDQHRNDYMVKEIALEDRWDAQILARPIAAIESAALAKTDVRSIIEWAHLQRGVKSEQE
jgi:hypothetical protein